MKRIQIPITSNKEEVLEFLRKNKSALLAEKKMYGKMADAVSYLCPLYDAKANSFKAADTINTAQLLDKDAIQVKIVINTTNLLDSHGDVHLKGIWKKSLKESGKSAIHLQSHKSDFEFVIADASDGEIKAYTQSMSWKDLGFDYKGETEALIFESTVKKARNPFMFDQYAKGFVKHHSVGMGYVKTLFCVNSEEKYWIEEKENWDQYYSEIVNKEKADEQGYFWAVAEGKVIEGSAVVRGSNHVTPTLEIKSEPGNHSDKDQEQQEPVKSTLNYDYLTKNFKL